MKITKLEAFPISIRYTRTETSALIAREGVTDVIVKLTAENGLIGWGAAASTAFWMPTVSLFMQASPQPMSPFSAVSFTMTSVTPSRAIKALVSVRV